MKFVGDAIVCDKAGFSLYVHNIDSILLVYHSIFTKWLTFQWIYMIRIANQHLYNILLKGYVSVALVHDTSINSTDNVHGGDFCYV